MLFSQRKPPYTRLVSRRFSRAPLLSAYLHFVFELYLHGETNDATVSKMAIRILMELNQTARTFWATLRTSTIRNSATRFSDSGTDAHFHSSLYWVPNAAACATTAKHSIVQ